MIVPPKDWTIDYFLDNESECATILNDPKVLQEIPSLNSAILDHFKDGQLVRFQGMLQDMHNPEYYFEKYKVVNTQTGGVSTRCGKYRDGASCQLHEQVQVESDENENSERYTWVVISTPGLNDWAKESVIPVVKNTVFTECSKNLNKRCLDDVEPMDCSEPIKKKEKLINDADACPSVSKGNSTTPTIVSKEHILNFPIPIEDGKCCIVKVYEDFPFKLNQIVDIVGFLSSNPNLSGIHDTDEILEDLEKQTHHPPPSIVPRLHAIRVVEGFNKIISETSNVFQRAESIRGDLRMVLSQLLFGDEIAADYLICHLISSIYMRKDSLCLGSFPLNITNLPKQCTNFTNEFYQILQQIVAKSHLMDITLENLNEMNFRPKKDYDCNRLTSGILQLSKNTHLILNETSLTTGQVTACGKKNYETISSLIEFQKVSYDFKFYDMDYDADIPVLILSETKSFIPCPTQIDLRPDPQTINLYPQILEAAKQYLKDETKLHDIRQYVATLKNVEFEITEETSNMIQEDFVKLRQSDKEYSANNLHSLIVLSRLMSISHGFNSLKPEMWKRSFEMEMERINRLQKRK